MGAFVLGVLVGWLAEWLFYTFWVKAGDNDEDCSAIKAELELKNRQISSLQTQLASATGNDKKKMSSAAPKSVSTKKTSTTKAASSKSTVKTTTVNTTNRPSDKAKPTAVKAKSKKTTKTTANQKTSSSKRKPKAGGDDFTKLSGIGPSMSATLKTLGIDTFDKLAATDDDILRDMLESSGARMNNNKEAMDSWNEQATLAAKGDFTALKKMQETFK